MFLLKKEKCERCLLFFSPACSKDESGRLPSSTYLFVFPFLFRVHGTRCHLFHPSTHTPSRLSSSASLNSFSFFRCLGSLSVSPWRQPVQTQGRRTELREGDAASEEQPPVSKLKLSFPRDDTHVAILFVLFLNCFCPPFSIVLANCARLGYTFWGLHNTHIHTRTLHKSVLHLARVKHKRQRKTRAGCLVLSSSSDSSFFTPVAVRR